MAIIKCPECGHDVSDRAKTCPHCGVDIAGQIITCPDCGEVIFKDAAECTNCHCPINGANVGYEPVVPTRPVVREAVKEAEQPATEPTEKEKKSAKKKVKRTYTAFVVSLVIALIVVLLGLYFYQTTQQQSELRAYQNAISSGEPAVLQNFLDVYVDAPLAHRDSIKIHLEALKKIDLEWDNAAASKSKAELQRYIGRHPGNIHVTEAKVMIDSIDWEVALADNTADAFQLYLDEHPDGCHIDEAHDMFERLDALRLKTEERDMLRQLFHHFFDALSQQDEAMLTATLAPELSSFMSREHVQQAEVVSYMRSLYLPGDITNIAFSMTDDWKIVKQPTEVDGQFVYTVSFSLEERIDRSNQELERYASYKVTARVNPSAKISAINMQKVVQ